jgi:hypothetical protein
MDPIPDDARAREHAREAFIADMKRRFEQAQAGGQSPEQLRELVTASAKEESRRQLPEVTARMTAWWSGLRNFLIVGGLAFGVAIGLALLVEHLHVAPLCERYAAQHGLRYQGVDYPMIGRSSSTTSPGRCIFADAAGRRDTVSLYKVEANAFIALLVSFALQIDFIIPAAFILIALLAVSLRGRSTRLNQGEHR